MDDVFGGDGGDEESFAKTRPQSAGSSSVPTQVLTSSLQDVAVVVNASPSSRRSSSRSDPVANLRALLDEVKGSQEQMQIISTEMIVEAHTKLLGEVRQMNEELAKQLAEYALEMDDLKPLIRIASKNPTHGLFWSLIFKWHADGTCGNARWDAKIAACKQAFEENGNPNGPLPEEVMLYKVSVPDSETAELETAMAAATVSGASEEAKPEGEAAPANAEGSG